MYGLLIESNWIGLGFGMSGLEFGMSGICRWFLFIDSDRENKCIF